MNVCACVVWCVYVCVCVSMRGVCGCACECESVCVHVSCVCLNCHVQYSGLCCTHSWCTDVDTECTCTVYM